jgi:aryl-alcohol dehydrogenase-like predicted oxidoreductase
LGQLVAGGARSDAVIATKYTAHPKFHPSNKKGEFINPNLGGNSRKSLVENLDESLKRLGTNYIDLLYVHNWEGITPVNEIMRSLDDVVRSGKVIYIAVSDVPAWQVARANTIAELRGWSSFIGLQTRYNLIDRELEFELGPMAEELGMSILPWGILAEGFLTGKHTKDEKHSESGRNETVSNHFKKEKNVKILGEVQKIAEEIGRSPAQVSLNWILQRPITIPIFGAKTVAQLEDNLAALEFTLTPEQMKRLNDVSAPEPFFPHNFAKRIPYFNNAGLTVKTKPNIWA